MRRLLVVLPLAAVAVLLWLFWQHAARDRDDRPGRTPTGTRTAGPDGLRDIDYAQITVAPEEREVPAVLRGVVYDPHGRTVRRAEVARIAPSPYELAMTGDNGSYALELRRAGRHLVQARLTIDLAPRRVFVDVPETGDPLPLDFHLEAAGEVFGEVKVGQEPLYDGIVDIEVRDLFGDWTRVVDVDCDNGLFNFPHAPPEGVPLRVVVTAREGFLSDPVPFEYAGTPVRIPTITLVRYPTLRLVLRLPDGTAAREVWAGDAAALRPRGGFVGENTDPGTPDPLPGGPSRIVLDEKRNVSARLALWDGAARHIVIREVQLALDQLREFEAVVRPGPFLVRRRLVDDAGAPVRARLRLGDETTETSPEGYFALPVPCGGVHTVFFTALHAGALGWVELAPLPGRRGAGFLLDADDDGADCVFAAGGRVLAVFQAPARIFLEARAAVHPSASDPPPPPLPPGTPRVDLVAVVGAEEGRGIAGMLTEPLGPGPYRWVRGVRETVAAGGRTYPTWTFPPVESGWALDVAERGLTVLDAR